MVGWMGVNSTKSHMRDAVPKLRVKIKQKCIAEKQNLF